METGIDPVTPIFLNLVFTAKTAYLRGFDVLVAVSGTPNIV